MLCIENTAVFIYKYVLVSLNICNSDRCVDLWEEKTCREEEEEEEEGGRNEPKPKV